MAPGQIQTSAQFLLLYSKLATVLIKLYIGLLFKVIVQSIFIQRRLLGDQLVVYADYVVYL